MIDCLVSSGLVTLLTPDPIRIGSYTFSGRSWYPLIDESPEPTAYDFQTDFLISHGMISPSPPWAHAERGKGWTPTEGIKPSPGRLIINGHNHTPFIRPGILNVGSIARTSRSQTHTPQVAVVYSPTEYELIPLSVQPNEEVFMPIQEETFAVDKAIEALRFSIEDVSFVNPFEVFDTIFSELNCPEEVRVEARKYLSRI